MDLDSALVRYDRLNERLRAIADLVNTGAIAAGIPYEHVIMSTMPAGKELLRDGTQLDKRIAAAVKFAGERLTHEFPDLKATALQLFELEELVRWQRGRLARMMAARGMDELEIASRLNSSPS